MNDWSDLARRFADSEFKPLIDYVLDRLEQATLEALRTSPSAVTTVQLAVPAVAAEIRRVLSVLGHRPGETNRPKE